MKIHPYLEELTKRGISPGLERMYNALSEIQCPHKGLKGALIAGTNGKGSTAFILYNLLASHGFKTALYTSPHIREINDRYLISGDNISDEKLLSYIELLRAISERNNLTLFEFETLIAFKYFYEQKVDFAVFEVGMGGRLDATNCFDTSIKVITSISKDHTEYLGETEEEILFEKAGIIKKGNIVISGIHQKNLLTSIERICKDRDAKLILLDRDIIIENLKEKDGFESFDYKYIDWKFDNVRLSLFGTHQVSNCALAITSFVELSREENFNIEEERIYHTLQNIRFGGRFEIVSRNPLIIIDGAHNEDGIRRLKETIITFNKDRKKIICIFSSLKNKEPEKKLEILKDIVDYFIFVENRHPLSLKKEEFILLAQKVNVGYFAIMDIESAIFRAHNEFNNYLILITGSLYTIEDAYYFLENIDGRRE